MNFFYGLLCLLAWASTDIFVRSQGDESHFVNEWVAEIPGGQETAREVAQQHGYRIVRTLDHIPDHYELVRSDTPHRSKRGADHHTKKLVEDKRVLYVEQQQHRPRVKREGLVDDHYGMNDPDFDKQWYMFQKNTAEVRRAGSSNDLNVGNVWAKNITGRDSVLCVLDDGIERSHPDLRDNYDAVASYDLNGEDDDPTPRYDPTNENKHGTRCAGEISMKANNGICGVGIAPDAKVGGIRMLDGQVTDSKESRAMSFNRDYIDVYSSSWGPSDDGKTLEGPGKLTERALEDGAKFGRNGKGSIFVVASGNGGGNGDNCNCDGYTSSPHTISVSSSSERGATPYYAERCASTDLSGCSSGSFSEAKVVSADLHGKCTDSHSGTSAAAPMIAAIVALLLESNRNLTARDVRHILLATSQWIPLADNFGWYKNGAGFCFNLAFGAGLANADKAVELADPKTWVSVGEQHKCIVEADSNSTLPQEFQSGEYVSVDLYTDGCAGQENEINSLEMIQMVATICHGRRGNIYAEIESPSGTITTLMLERNGDSSDKCFNEWAFMSLHNWGENPRGKWIFRVADRSNDNYKGSLQSAKLVLYGTKDKPEYQKRMARTCDHLKSYADTLTIIVPENRDRMGTSLGKMKQAYLAQKEPTIVEVKPAGQSQTPDEKSSFDSLRNLLSAFKKG